MCGLGTDVAQSHVQSRSSVKTIQNDIHLRICIPLLKYSRSNFDITLSKEGNMSIFTTLFFSSLTFVYAETPTESSINELLKVLQVQEQQNLVMNQSFDSIQSTIPLDERDLFEAFRNDMVNSTELIERLIPVYQKYLTQSEVDALIRFYSTVEGQSFVTKQPEILKESMKIGQQWGVEKSLSYQARLNEGTDFNFTKSNTFNCKDDETIIGTRSYVKIDTSFADVFLTLYNADGSETSHSKLFGSFFYNGTIDGFGSLQSQNGLLYKDNALYISMKTLFALTPKIKQTIDSGGYFEIKHSENLSDALYYVSTCLVSKSTSGIEKTKSILQAETNSIANFKTIESQPFDIQSSERLILESYGWRFQGIDIYQNGKIILSLSPNEMMTLGLISPLTEYWLIHPEKFKEQSFWQQSNTIIVFYSRSHEAGNGYDITGPDLYTVKTEMTKILETLPDW